MRWPAPIPGGAISAVIASGAGKGGTPPMVSIGGVIAVARALSTYQDVGAVPALVGSAERVR